MYEKPASKRTFDMRSIWGALCKLSPELLHNFMTKIWSGVRKLWQKRSDALRQEMNRHVPGRAQSDDLFLDCYNLLAASWDSLGRPDNATGLAIPLVRLARLMSTASTKLPKWLTTVPRTNDMIWKANASLGLSDSDISWDNIISASRDLKSSSHFALLHLYTMLISQSIRNNPCPVVLPERRNEVMSLVVERCCKQIGGEAWLGRPSYEFRDMLVFVYGELRRLQLEKGMPTLKGHDVEEEVVRGIWALASWNVCKS
ncbi:hypothetical protein ACEQ8H_007869 [Pleosporales sp. CAS-2024a]